MAEPKRPPRENLIRATGDEDSLSVRRDGSSEMPVLTGYAAVFDRWTEIASSVEGHFMERIAPGAFAKTITEGRDQIRSLLNHGRDPQVGNKPLGPVIELEEDAHGLRYAVQLLDTSYNRDLIPALDAGLYGSSFRMQVQRDDVVGRPKKTAQNPSGIMERTIQEVRMPEFGPVTFPAYQDATAGLRSMTDEFLVETLAEDPERLERYLGRAHVSVPAAVAPVETSVDAAWSTLVAGIAAARGVTVEAVRSDFAQGHLILAVKEVATSDPKLDEAEERLDTASASEPEPPEATTPDEDASAPEPPVATTREPSRHPSAISGTRKDDQSWRL